MEATQTTLTPLIGMTLPQLRDVAAECGMPPFAAGQMAKWLYEKRAASIDDMTNLSKTARATLARRYTIGRTAPKAEARSVDGTVKYLFEGVGGRDIEAVYIPDRDRATLCVSSQAGCRMRCRFCMTGRQGFHGNLTAGQIINQVLSIPESATLTNIVFMGMGEPMDNLDPVLGAIDILTSSWGLAWSPKRITVSSIGKIDTLRTLLDITKVHIAISVHSPFAEERASLMPVEKSLSAEGCTPAAARLRLRPPEATVGRVYNVGRTQRQHAPCPGIGTSVARTRCQSQPNPLPCHTRQRPAHIARRHHGGVPRPSQRAGHNRHHTHIARRGYSRRMRYACR